jgi:C-terminal processing protease CtpA/Prc
VVLLGGLASTTTAQKLEDDRKRGLSILKNIQSELKARYWDPTFGGRDLEALFARAADDVRAASNEAHISGLLTQLLIELDDSHTLFYPPPAPFEVDYGFEMHLVGERAYITAVDADSDAAAQGLRRGTELLAVEGVRAGRASLWRIRYALRVRPRKALRLRVQAPGGAPEDKLVKAKVSESRRVRDINDWIVEERAKADEPRRPVVVALLGEKAAAIRLESFGVEASEFERALKLARGREALVLDLRGNPGGDVDLLRRVVGAFFDRDVSLGTLQWRKKTETLVAKRRRTADVFSGRLIVLIDADSASAAETTARVVQLEGRATVLGDSSAGAVMVSRTWVHSDGPEFNFILYGLSITEADVVMRDGGRLEKAGVTPDEVVLPTPEDMALKRDPVLARAAALVGVTLTPEAAGSLYDNADDKGRVTEKAAP